MFIKATPGSLVRDPFTRIELPSEGAEVSDTDLYWHRLLNDGSVELAEPPAEAKAAKAASAS